MAPMRSLHRMLVLTLAVLLLNVSLSEAFKDYISSDDYDYACGGVYYSNNQSEIAVVMDPESRGNAVAVIYEWNDNNLVGKTDADGETRYVCDSVAVRAELCTEQELGTVLYDKSVASTIQTGVFNFTTEEESGIQYMEYRVPKTGYYCARTWPMEVNGVEAQYTGVVEFKNKFGQLAGSDFPKLPFYGALSLVYTFVGITWMILCAKHWREILTIQHIISGVILFLMVEMAFNWGFWDDYNKTGKPSIALLVMVAILNSGRNSISLFMLLIVSMGYGVVLPTLGGTMKKVIILSLAHFLFGIIYSAGTMSPVEDVSAMIVLIVVVPLALTMTSFYIWTLQSLTSTISTLNLRRQTEKVKMYTRLWRLLVFSLTVLCAFFVINTFNFMNMTDPDWPASYWRIKWFLLDGWLNILYLFVFVTIVILWRPTENNKRYGIEQLEQDDFDEADEHADHNNARAAESMGLTGMKLRPQRRDYELEDDEVAMFDIGEEEDEDEDDQDDDRDDDLEAGGRSNSHRSNAGSRTGSASSRSPAFRSDPFSDVAEDERLRLEASKLN
ncbi:hypothetical protein EMPS_00918 [Entomortierella parvispora]|uniref:Membrane protein PTM1 n=1 Tax=Entomortierella parvispora TaxID=205924 RepID=A0A9P3LSB0_9FUNG|nr:hypothetical protein EMPS_00918 [Entomortierella parvispora]